MICIILFVHGISGKFLGTKVYISQGIRGSTITIYKRIYSNIVQVNGKLKKL